MHVGVCAYNTYTVFTVCESVAAHDDTRSSAWQGWYFVPLCRTCVCAVFFLLVPVCQVADPSQAYYQGVTEGGRQQRQCLNET